MASRALSLKLRYGLSLVSIVPPSCVFTLESYSSLYITIRPLRGRREREIQGAPSHCPPDSIPLKPRQGPCPWTPLLKNLYLKVPPAPRQGTSPPAPPFMIRTDSRLKLME